MVLVLVELVAQLEEAPRESSSSSSRGGRANRKPTFAALAGKRDSQGTQYSWRIRHLLRWQRTRAIPVAAGGGGGGSGGGCAARRIAEGELVVVVAGQQGG